MTFKWLFWVVVRWEIRRKTERFRVVFYWWFLVEFCDGVLPDKENEDSDGLMVVWRLGFELFRVGFSVVWWLFGGDQKKK